MKYVFCLGVLSLALAACAEQTAMRLAADTVQLDVSTAPVYGSLEPQRRAMRMAAEETVKSGYDKFVFLDSQTRFKQNVIGVIPGHAQGSGQATYASGYGKASSQYSAVGPTPIAAPRHEGRFIVKMFKADDPAGANAIDARTILAEPNG
ncbi:MAG TPA: hypothetical protein PK271_04760 [Hyphomicrobium sp.]|uniref:hypothetical protein n=1 Tax=Hyphomicrobium sp. TaxID=82 RepID=UPI002D0D94B2|nr:hypothetical protein [Hyphomicrobium sp.]HRN87892.1 hypothetical protein [Hyphomicrobium sp.]